MTYHVVELAHPGRCLVDAQMLRVRLVRLLAPNE